MIDEKQILIRNDVLIDYLKGKEELRGVTVTKSNLLLYEEVVD